MNEIVKGKEDIMKRWRMKRVNDKGMGTVEIILIIVVLIGLVLIFKNQLLELTKTIFEKIAVDSSAILA